MIDDVGGSIACQFCSEGGFPGMKRMGRKVERGSSFGEFGSPARDLSVQASLGHFGPSQADHYFNVHIHPLYPFR